MGTYFVKKKLMEDNSDLYISPFDKNLDIGSLSHIVNLKRDYKTAESAGDKQSMIKSNNEANSVRQNAGRYDGGSDGSEYNRMYKDYETNRPGKYKSRYGDDIDDILYNISTNTDFDYNAEDDPLYQNYRSIYMMLGDDAYERALSENAMRTGGMVSSSAQSAAMQAKNKYNSMLAAKIPELYELAYGRHRDSISDMYDQLDVLSDLEKDEYSKYRDRVGDFEADRKYFYGVDKDDADRVLDTYKFDTDMEYNLMRDANEDKRAENELNYKKERDAITDSQWANEFNYSKLRDSVKDSQWREEFDYKKEADEQSKYMNQLKTAITLAKAMTGRYPVGYGSVEAMLEKIKNP